MLIHAVNLEQVLDQIQADPRNLHGGRPLRYEWLVKLPLWHIDAPVGWGRPLLRPARSNLPRALQRSR
jgi:hypothetical protein